MNTNVNLEWYCVKWNSNMNKPYAINIMKLIIIFIANIFQKNNSNINTIKQQDTAVLNKSNPNHATIIPIINAATPETVL